MVAAPDGDVARQLAQMRDAIAAAREDSRVAREDGRQSREDARQARVEVVAVRVEARAEVAAAREEVRVQVAAVREGARIAGSLGARVHTSLTRLSAGVVAAARARLSSARAPLSLADGASMDAFEIIERVGRRSNPAVAGSRWVLRRDC
jgi:hypothetical protein